MIIKVNKSMTSIDSKILILNLNTYDYIDIPIQEEMKIGFHSIFIPKK